MSKHVCARGRERERENTAPMRLGRFSRLRSSIGCARSVESDNLAHRAIASHQQLDLAKLSGHFGDKVRSNRMSIIRDDECAKIGIDYCPVCPVSGTRISEQAVPRGSGPVSEPDAVSPDQSGGRGRLIGWQNMSSVDLHDECLSRVSFVL